MQIFVTVTEDYIESKIMAKKIVGDKFEIGDYKYQKCIYKVKKQTIDNFRSCEETENNRRFEIDEEKGY